MTPKTLPYHLVDVDPNQPRREMDGDLLKSMAMNIRDLGQLQPVIVYRVGKRFCLVDGHQRYRAIGLLNRDEINALVLDEAPTSDTILLTQLAANCMRSDLKPIERALAYQRLKDSRGWTNVELAESLHVSKSTITQTLSYLTLPAELQAKLDSGELAGSTAYTISRADGETRADLIAKASTGELKRDDAQREVSRNRRKTYRSAFSLPTASVTVAAAQKLTLAELIALWKQLEKECRKADSQGLDVSTLEKVLSVQEALSSKTKSGGCLLMNVTPKERFDHEQARHKPQDRSGTRLRDVSIGAQGTCPNPAGDGGKRATHRGNGTFWQCVATRSIRSPQFCRARHRQEPRNADVSEPRISSYVTQVLIEKERFHDGLTLRVGCRWRLWCFLQVPWFVAAI